MRLLRKIHRRMSDIVHQYKNDCDFSKKLAVLRAKESLYSLFNRNSAEKYRPSIDHIIKQYLENCYQSVIEKHAVIENSGIYEPNSPIWVCWWTGLDSAPDLVKQCVKSIIKNSSGHRVHIITSENYKEYLDIPDYIIDKLNFNKMCIANFTDYLRVSLIEQYGGLWLDATIFVPKPLPDWIFRSELYTCKSEKNSKFVSSGRWTSFCIGGWKKHIFFTIAKECFETYWRNEESSIDYLLVDYTFDCIYNNHSFCKAQLDAIPVTNLARNKLSNAMVNAKAAENFYEYLDPATFLYKLSWREKYNLYTADGKPSVYDYFLKMTI